MAIVCRIQVRAALDDRWSHWFGGLTLAEQPDGTTTMSGPLADQSALHAVLERIRDLGLVLVSVDGSAAEAPPADTAEEAPE